MTSYYNENDPKAAAWLRELIDQGHVAQGEVDERSILDIHPSDLRGFTQCHFFAGIGVWSYALRQAGWPDDKPVWTGSCPCQPFSQAGKGAGIDDERHLWPSWFHLIDVRRPGVVFGEQVAGKAGLGWFDLVQADLEGATYASGAIDLCAAGVGAPHLRQRLYFVAERVADTQRARLEERHRLDRNNAKEQSTLERSSSPVGGLADTDSGRPASWSETAQTPRQRGTSDPTSGDVGYEFPGPVNGFWRDADWLRCTDDKWRAVESSTFPLANGAPARVGRLRGYGNAIVAPVAQAFVEAYLHYRSNTETEQS